MLYNDALLKMCPVSVEEVNMIISCTVAPHTVFRNTSSAESSGRSLTGFNPQLNTNGWHTFRSMR